MPPDSEDDEPVKAAPKKTATGGESPAPLASLTKERAKPAKGSRRLPSRKGRGGGGGSAASAKDDGDNDDDEAPVPAKAKAAPAPAKDEDDEDDEDDAADSPTKFGFSPSPPPAKPAEEPKPTGKAVDVLFGDGDDIFGESTAVPKKKKEAPAKKKAEKYVMYPLHVMDVIWCGDCASKRSLQPIDHSSPQTLTV